MPTGTEKERPRSQIAPLILRRKSLLLCSSRYRRAFLRLM